jgi:hypothetical protein
MVSVKRTALVAFVILVLLSLLWFAGGRTWADQFLARFLTEARNEFTIPAAKISLNLAVTQDREELTVCNRGVAPWDGTLIRINGGYLAKMKGLSVGDCARIRKTSFLSTVWKHFPAPRDLQVTRNHPEIRDLQNFGRRRALRGSYTGTC